MIHDVDILLSLVQSDAKVSALAAYLLLQIQLILPMQEYAVINGTVASITSSRVAKDKVRKIKLFQETYIQQ